MPSCSESTKQLADSSVDRVCLAMSAPVISFIIALALVLTASVKLSPPMLWSVCVLRTRNTPPFTCSTVTLRDVPPSLYTRTWLWTQSGERGDARVSRAVLPDVVGQHGRGRLVDQPQHVEACSFGRLPAQKMSRMDFVKKEEDDGTLAEEGSVRCDVAYLNARFWAFANSKGTVMTASVTSEPRAD
ncbi:hypothetical protein EYF80_016809 [Liparis tanakae]|uniref:Uncharacterized protein n=1 Tax=Liparis tanakae TaxID=230148 RepID=A0A4Z2I4X7_9TELE|nr:hypothetical protein EYF80_016809 [Liparis tanakae]